MCTASKQVKIDELGPAVLTDRRFETTISPYILACCCVCLDGVTAFLCSTKVVTSQPANVVSDCRA